MHLTVIYKFHIKNNINLYFHITWEEDENKIYLKFYATERGIFLLQIQLIPYPIKCVIKSPRLSNVTTKQRQNENSKYFKQTHRSLAQAKNYMPGVY